MLLKKGNVKKYFKHMAWHSYYLMATWCTKGMGHNSNKNKAIFQTEYFVLYLDCVLHILLST